MHQLVSTPWATIVKIWRWIKFQNVFNPFITNYQLNWPQLIYNFLWIQWSLIIFQVFAATISALVAGACAAPAGLFGHHGVAPLGHAHLGHAAPLLGHGLGHVAHHGVGLAHHGVAHAVHAPVVAHAVHAAPAYHAPVVAHAAPAYHAPAEVYADEVSPYTFTYAVADDYSKSSFNAEEQSDGASNVAGGYSVALPDGRIQHVKYTSNAYDGYVADVTYEGTAVYPEAPAPGYHAAPAPAYHA